MADVHTSVKSDASGNSVKFDNPGVIVSPVGVGQPITIVKDASGKPVSTSGQVTGTSVIFNSPG